jgi:hypothetical protein
VVPVDKEGIRDPDGASQRSKPCCAKRLVHRQDGIQRHSEIDELLLKLNWSAMLLTGDATAFKSTSGYVPEFASKE